MMTDTDTLTQNTVTADQVWAWLQDVPDPEIPVVSVVDLGIVRDVDVEESGRVHVTITPTYSGCPATSVIRLEVENALRNHGLDDFEVRSRISPAWTTAWISEDGRRKLYDYGIAPPVEGETCAGAMTMKSGQVVQCPNCGGTDTECVSRFGSTPCKASYRCKTCLEPFDYFKPF